MDWQENGCGRYTGMQRRYQFVFIAGAPGAEASPHLQRYALYPGITEFPHLQRHSISCKSNILAPGCPQVAQLPRARQLLHTGDSEVSVTRAEVND